jgi:hypothetical protein
MRPGESGAPGLSSFGGLKPTRLSRCARASPRQFAPVRANTAAAKWIDDIDFVGIPDRFLLDSALPLWTNRS